MYYLFSLLCVLIDLKSIFFLHFLHVSTLFFFFQWVNSQEVLRHVGGHLPFEVQLKSSLNINGANRLTVAVNNTLTPSTLPPGTIHYMKDTNR